MAANTITWRSMAPPDLTDNIAAQQRLGETLQRNLTGIGTVVDGMTTEKKTLWDAAKTRNTDALLNQINTTTDLDSYANLKQALQTSLAQHGAQADATKVWDRYGKRDDEIRAEVQAEDAYNVWSGNAAARPYIADANSMINVGNWAGAREYINSNENLEPRHRAELLATLNKAEKEAAERKLRMARDKSQLDLNKSELGEHENTVALRNEKQKIQAVATDLITSGKVKSNRELRDAMGAYMANSEKPYLNLTEDVMNWMDSLWLGYKGGTDKENAQFLAEGEAATAAAVRLFDQVTTAHTSEIEKLKKQLSPILTDQYADIVDRSSAMNAIREKTKAMGITDSSWLAFLEGTGTGQLGELMNKALDTTENWAVYDKVDKKMKKVFQSIIDDPQADALQHKAMVHTITGLMAQGSGIGKDTFTIDPVAFMRDYRTNLFKVMETRPKLDEINTKRAELTKKQEDILLKQARDNVERAGQGK